MQKDWFPFFSMLFWCVTKVTGLAFGLFGIHAFVAYWEMPGFSFGYLVIAVIVPLALAALLLVTEIVFDLATAEMRGRQAVAK
jgi:hypothetical protein